MHINASYGKSVPRCAMLRSENRSCRFRERKHTLLLLQAGGESSASTNTISNSSRCEQAKFDQTLERHCSCRKFNCDWYETGGTCHSVKGTCRAVLSCLQWPAAVRGEISPNPIRLKLSLYIRWLGSQREMRGWTKEKLLLLPEVKKNPFCGVPVSLGAVHFSTVQSDSQRGGTWTLKLHKATIPRENKLLLFCGCEKALQCLPKDQAQSHLSSEEETYNKNTINTRASIRRAV